MNQKQHIPSEPLRNVAGGHSELVWDQLNTISELVWDQLSTITVLHSSSQKAVCFPLLCLWLLKAVAELQC